MIDLYYGLKLAHILGAAVLFGTGLGIAFFMLMAHRSGNAAHIARTAATVVIADTVFTATAVVLQPLTGAALAHVAGFSLWEPWIVASLGLYVLVGLCWLPVAWIQIRIRDIVRGSDEAAAPSEPYHRLFRVWFALGWPAFLGVVAIFALMIWKPALW
jgi:uncharacterized membrane protein